jgi:hypothetical protein
MALDEADYAHSCAFVSGSDPAVISKSQQAWTHQVGDKALK